MTAGNYSLEALNHENSSLREALKQVLYQNEMLLNWVNGAVVTVDRAGMVVSANEIALSSHDFKAEDLVGKQYHNTCHHTLDDGGEYPWEFCPVFAAIEDGSSHHVTNDLLWKSDGSSFIADYIVCPIRDENNSIPGATIIFRNLTEQKLQEIKRIHGLKLESIGELLAGIAHEINTPIQFIGSNVNFLNDVIEDLLTLMSKYKKPKLALGEQGKIEDLIKEITDFEDEIDLECIKDEAPKAIEQTRQDMGLRG